MAGYMTASHMALLDTGLVWVEAVVILGQLSTLQHVHASGARPVSSQLAVHIT